MNTVVFGAILPIPIIVRKPNEYTKKLITLLTNNKDFINDVEEIRLKHGLPKKGYEVKDIYNEPETQAFLIDGLTLDQNIVLNELIHEYNKLDVEGDGEVQMPTQLIKRFEKIEKTMNPKQLEIFKNPNKSRNIEGLLEEKYEKFLLEFKRPTFLKLGKIIEEDNKLLRKKYGLPPYTDLALTLFIEFGAFQEIDTSLGITYCVGEEGISKEIKDYREEVISIIIFEKVSKRDLIKWVNKNWDNVIEEATALPQKLTLKSNNIEIGAQINTLRKDKLKTYSQISDDLSQMYPNDTRVIDPIWIKITHARHLKLLSKLQSTTGNKK